ncbi:MAG: hypothetical protein U0835_05035 [Isosphaeraceae bacterium]
MPAGTQVRPQPDEPGHSGRVLVTGIVVGVLLLWGGLNLTFRQWRARYAERAAYGVQRVAGTVEPLSDVFPTGQGGEDPAGPTPESQRKWRQAVADTREMLVKLTAANLLDRDEMDALGADLAARVAAARPETARATLAAIWDLAEDRAGPVVQRHPRPALLPPRPAPKPEAGRHRSNVNVNGAR